MKATIWTMMCLLWCVTEVHSQTVPYVTFRGENLPNHSYVDLSLEPGAVDQGDPIHVICYTDLAFCCSGPQRPYSGDWYFPNITRLPFSGDIYQHPGQKRVDLIYHRNSNNFVSGIYRCDIETNAVHSNDYTSSDRETVYAGLYTSGGEYTNILYMYKINVTLFWTYLYTIHKLSLLPSWL